MSPKTLSEIWSTPAKMLVGGILFITGAFSVIGTQNLINDYDATGNPIESAYVSESEFNVYCTGTGGLAKYDACAIKNPVTARSQTSGSGLILELCMEIGNNPANASFDVVEVSSLGAASGKVLINNLSGTGAHACATVPEAWGSGRILSAKSLTAPTSSFTARLRGKYRDVFGE